MFVKEYELRYSDIDNCGKIKTSTVLDLLQDISIAHADYAGLGAEKLRSVSIACLLASWRVKFIKPIVDNDTVTVKTGLMSTTKCEATRKYEIWQNDECKVIATAVWFTVNTEKMRIARAVDELFVVFENLSEEDNNLPSVKLKPLDDVGFLGDAQVKRHHLDTNNHINNIKSVEEVLDFLPENFEISELQVKYRKELKKNEFLKIYGKQTEDGFYYEIRNENGDLCVLVYVNN